MKMTIYLDEELYAEVKADPALNASAVCQDALRTELALRKTLATVDEDMARIEHMVDRDGVPITVAFVGRLLHAEEHGPDLCVYLTRRHRLAVYSEADSSLADYDDLNEMERAGFDPLIIASVASALGVDRPIELDI